MEDYPLALSPARVRTTGVGFSNMITQMFGRVIFMSIWGIYIVNWGIVSFLWTLGMILLLGAVLISYNWFRRQG